MRPPGTRPKPPSQRQLRVAEEIRHVLAGVFARGEIRDPDLADVLITVTEVRISPDLKHATAFVTRLGRSDIGEKLPALRRAAPFLRTPAGACAAAALRAGGAFPGRHQYRQCHAYRCAAACARGGAGYRAGVGPRWRGDRVKQARPGLCPGPRFLSNGFQGPLGPWRFQGRALALSASLHCPEPCPFSASPHVLTVIYAPPISRTRAVCANANNAAVRWTAGSSSTNLRA